MTQSAGSDRPPRWAEHVLRLCLNARDRDTVAGDLLEEYREVILPARGRFRAHLWYVKQAVSLVNGLTLGIVVGAAFGTWNLVYTAIAPLAEDTPLALAAFYGPMFVTWGLAGFVAYRRSGQLTQAVKVGAIVGFATFIAFYVAIVLRVNLFLDVISQRSDWQGLVARYQASGFDSFRAFANYEYATGAPLMVFVGVTIGAATALIGGLVGMADAQLRPVRRV